MTMRELTVDGHRLAYRESGAGSAMVFVHGTPSSSAEFEAVMTAMSAHCRCIAIDHLGFGASDKPPAADYSLATHRARLAAALAQLGVDRFHMVVHDFGGPIALPLLLDQPERALSLTLMSTWLWPLGRTDASLEKQRRFMTSRLVRWLYLNANFSARVLVKAAWGRHRPLTSAHHRRYMAAFPSRDQRHGTVAFLNALFDAGEPTWGMHARTERLRGVPTTIVWGARDIISLGTFEHWQRLLPHADAVLLPEVGHFIADEAPELLIPVLERAEKSAVHDPLRR
jgi:pimeloyl-ACP methyl ester carboxylesterase